MQLSVPLKFLIRQNGLAIGCDFVSFFTTLKELKKNQSMINVTCAIILQGDKILATQRSAEMNLPLKWEFPGGKIEIGENAEACILREIKEELNIDIKITQRLTNSIYQYPTFTINLIPFLGKYLAGEIVLAEHSDFRWLEKSELMSLDWAPADIPIVEEILKSKHV